MKYFKCQIGVDWSAGADTPNNREKPWYFIRAGDYYYSSLLNPGDSLTINFDEKLTEYELRKCAKDLGLWAHPSNPKDNPADNPFYLP